MGKVKRLRYRKDRVGQADGSLVITQRISGSNKDWTSLALANMTVMLRRDYWRGK